MTNLDNKRVTQGGYAARILTKLSAEPDHVALHWRGQDIRAGQFAQSVVEAVHALRDLSVGPGSLVAVLAAPNSPDMLCARYAANLLGAAVCYLGTTNPGSAKRTLPFDAQLRILLDTAASVLFTDEENAGLARELAKLAPTAPTVTGFGASEAVRVAIEPMNVVASRQTQEWNPQALAMVGFSSGSTGQPKGIRIPGRVLDFALQSNMAVMFEPQPPRLLVTTPLSHSVALMTDAVLAIGGTVFLHEEFEAGQVLKAVAEHRISRTFLATSHLYQLLDHEGCRTADLSSLMLMLYSGSTAAPARIADAVDVFGSRLVQAYGTSESGAVTLLGPAEHQDPHLRSSVGRPFPGVELKVCDLDSGERVDPGEIGEVCFRSPLLMDGYWGDPELTAQVLTDKWYRSGDIGRLDEDGYLYLLDRIADVVKTRGVKVYPAVVERELLALPEVANAAVYGVRDEDDQEHLYAAVVPRPDARIVPDSLRSAVHAVLSAEHVPEVVLLLDELPLNAAGKPDKLQLRSRARQADLDTKNA